MSLTIALAGNPNCGKSTLFNLLTGSNQYVGNWPGVTVEKKEGKAKKYEDIKIIDLPGIYSLSPYTLEEVISRNYIIQEKPDVILNIIDGTNIERNLYLTTQLLELGIPLVIAINMMDVVKKNGDKFDTVKLKKIFGCDVVEISALKGTGIDESIRVSVKNAKEKKIPRLPELYSPIVEEKIQSVEEKLSSTVNESSKRFFAVKILEKDKKIEEILKCKIDATDEIDSLESKMDDITESIITNERYNYISNVIKEFYIKNHKEKLTVSDKIDKVITNRIVALPIFALIMIAVYYISVTSLGGILTDWVNDGVFGEGWSLFGLVDVPSIPAALGGVLESLNCAPWLTSLILDGIVAGLGAVLGFVPQILLLYICLSILEECGYMARVAFIMDRIFRKFGLSGKSFIPMLIGSGCGVPAVMATRTIENERDRRMTIMTTTFIPCGAKMPIIGLVSGAFFGGAWWVAPSAYFVGIAAIIISGIILKKTKMFAGEASPFVMELPEYHMPTFKNVARSTGERGSSFIKKAGTIILLSTIFIWFTSSFGFVDGHFGMVDDLSDGLLSYIGRGLAVLFKPLGWGEWQFSVAAVTGLVAKENVIGTCGILFGFSEVAENGEEIWQQVSSMIPVAAGYGFLVFNLLCAPCFAAIGAIKREMNSPKWTWFAIGYQTIFAYIISFIIYNVSTIFTEGVVGINSILSFIFIGGIIYMLIRKNKYQEYMEGEVA